MSSDRNIPALTARVTASLVDWDMSSDRNSAGVSFSRFASLVDWDMSSDRNGLSAYCTSPDSLVDWDMSSDRRLWLDRRYAPVKPKPAPRRGVYQVGAKQKAAIWLAE